MILLWSNGDYYPMIQGDDYPMKQGDDYIIIQGEVVHDYPMIQGG